MIKKMQINIDIDTESDTPYTVKELILELMKRCGDRCFAIESVTIDNIENFKIGIGFMNELSKKQIN